MLLIIIVCFFPKTRDGNFTLIQLHLFDLQVGFLNSTAPSGYYVAHSEKWTETHIYLRVFHGYGSAERKEAHLNTVAGVNLSPDIYSGAGGSAANDKQVSCALRYRLVLGCIVRVSAAWWCPVLLCFCPFVFHLQTCNSLHAPTAFMTPWFNITTIITLQEKTLSLVTLVKKNWRVQKIIYAFRPFLSYKQCLTEILPFL